MDQVLLDQVLYWLHWLLLPFHALHDLFTAVASGICSGLSWLHEVLHYFWTMLVSGIAVAFSKLLIPLLHALCDLSYLWLRAIFGISIGLFVTRKTIGLLVCVLGNAALFALVSWMYGRPENLIVLLGWSIFAFWLAGRILRWVFLRVPGGRPLVVAGAMIVVGLSMLDAALHHSALVWWVVRIAGIGLAALGGILAIFRLQALWVAGAMIVVGLSMLDVALHHSALVWWVVRIAGIGLAAAGGILAIFGLQALWEERIALLLDDRRFRRS